MKKEIPKNLPQIPRLRTLLMLLALSFSLQSFATTVETNEDTNCGNISGFEFSNGNSSIAIQNDEEYYIGDLPSNFYVDLIVSGYSQSASFELENKDTGQEYNIGENVLPYTFPGGNGAWSYGTGEFEVKAKIFKYDNCAGSYCDSETIKFRITNTRPCGDVSGFVFTNGSITIPIVNDQSYDITQMPSGFYIDLVVSAYPESTKFTVKNKDTGSEDIIIDNSAPYTYPTNASWDLGIAEFEIKAEIYMQDGAQGSKCDYDTIKFTLFDSSIPNCPCSGGLTELTFSYSGGSSISTNSGSVTNNGDGTYTISNNGVKIEKDLKIYTSSGTSAIHTSCSQNLLGLTFNGVTVIGYVDNDGNQASIANGCTSAPTCGTISGFEFSNGTTSVAIVNDAEYSLSQLPNNFYVDVIVNGFSESASIKVKNEYTGQEYTIGENYLPYTFPAGNGAWNLPAGEYKVEAKIFEVDGCAGSYCDSDYIKFKITNSSACGQIDGLNFSNGTNTVAIANGGSYDLAALPYNFYVDVVVSGMTESAYHKITNLDTGEEFTNGTNTLPYTYPSGNQAWNLGTGTFQFYSEIFKYDNCAGTKCDHICYTFTLFEQNCGEIAEFQFANGTDTPLTIVDGEVYDINSLPVDFYVDAVVTGPSESVRLEVENTDTNEE